MTMDSHDITDASLLGLVGFYLSPQRFLHFKDLIYSSCNVNWNLVDSKGWTTNIKRESCRFPFTKVHSLLEATHNVFFLLCFVYGISKKIQIKYLVCFRSQQNMYPMSHVPKLRIILTMHTNNRSNEVRVYKTMISGVAVSN